MQSSSRMMSQLDYPIVKSRRSVIIFANAVIRTVRTHPNLKYLIIPLIDLSTLSKAIWHAPHERFFRELDLKNCCNRRLSTGNAGMCRRALRTSMQSLASDQE